MVFKPEKATFMIDGKEVGIATDINFNFDDPQPTSKQAPPLHIGYMTGTLRMSVKPKDIRKLRRFISECYTKGIINGVGIFHTQSDIHRAMEWWRRLLPYKWCSKMAKARAILKLEVQKGE